MISATSLCWISSENPAVLSTWLRYSSPRRLTVNCKRIAMMAAAAMALPLAVQIAVRARSRGSTREQRGSGFSFQALTCTHYTRDSRMCVPPRASNVAVLVYRFEIERQQTGGFGSLPARQSQ